MITRGLGATVPSFGNWQFFTNAALTSQTFKFLFSGITLPIRSYLLVQSVFNTGEVSPAIRVYPSNQEVFKDISLPQALLQDGQSFRFLACKKVWKNKNFIGSRFEPNWSVNAFEMIPEADNQAENILQLESAIAQVLANQSAMDLKLDALLQTQNN